MNENSDRLREELEFEYAIRLNELVTLENIMNQDTNEDNLCIARKSLINMLYAYFEGFCKKSLLIYVDYVNNERLEIKDVKYGLASSSSQQVFKNLNNANYKPVDLGEKSLKEDMILQKYGRQREFISKFHEFESRPLHLSDDLVDTESNLRAHVLKKILYTLEMNFQIVDDNQNQINKLVNLRNSYAHGDRVRGPEPTEYNEYRENTIDVMRKVKDCVYEQFKNKGYLVT